MVTGLIFNTDRHATGGYFFLLVCVQGEPRLGCMNVKVITYSNAKITLNSGLFLILPAVWT